MSYEEYMRAQREYQERRESGTTTTTPRVGFFSLKDGGETFIRFAFSSPAELKIYTTHQTTINGKFRRVACLRTFKEPISNCPLCAAGDKIQTKVYLPLIEYTRDENENLKAEAKIWERSVSYLQNLADFAEDYGDLRSVVFKVKRRGAKLDTVYNLLPANPQIYNEELYVKDFSAFEGYDVLGGPLLNYDFDKMKELAGNLSNGETFTPDVLPFPVEQEHATVEYVAPDITRTNVEYKAPDITLTSGGQRRIKY